jgi:hypothetical protein
MKAITCSCLTSAVALIATSAIAVAPAASRDALPLTEQRTVALAAQVQPLPAPATLKPSPPLELLGQQVNFHVALLVDFVVTGAQLVDRQLQIPGTLVQNVQNGTPLPVAVGRALQTFAEVELDAGRELVGFAVEYLDFQLRFLAELVALPFAVVAAVGQFVGSFIAGTAPAPVTEPSVSTQLVSASAESASHVSPADATARTTRLSTDTRIEGSSDVVSVERPDDAPSPAPTVDDQIAEQRNERTSDLAVSDSEAVATSEAQGALKDAKPKATRGDQQRHEPGAAETGLGDKSDGDDKESAGSEG